MKKLAICLAILLGILLTIPVGLVFALPALRTRGVNLAVVTLGLGFLVSEVVFNNANYLGNRLDGGTKIGLVIVGPQATELVNAGVVGITAEATIDTVADSIAAHPTLAEAVKEAALVSLGRPIHLPPARQRAILNGRRSKSPTPIPSLSPRWECSITSAVSRCSR